VVSRGSVALLLGLMLVPPLAAQLPQAEAAFASGDYAKARQLYNDVLAHDSLNSRALYRLATLDSWENNLPSSLARFRTLRRIEPLDVDIMVEHAQVLAWADDIKWSVALYDTVLARDSTRVDAIAGRARAVAWGGDLNRAEVLWRQALERYPDNADILTGLAQTLYWRGRPEAAQPYLVRARQVAPNDKTSRDLLSVVQAATRPVVNVSADGGDDSDDNSWFLLNGSYGWSLTSGIRTTLHAGWRRAADPVRAGSSFGADALFEKSLNPSVSVRAGAGVSHLSPDSGSGATPLTLQAGVGLRPSATTSVGIGYSRSPFDETALLIDSGFVWDAVEGTVDWTPRPKLDAFGTVNSSWLSDGNRRLIFAVGAMQAVGRGFHAGGYGRYVTWQDAFAGRGYFAPDHFWTLEGRGVYNWRKTVWAVRVDGGLGAQNVGTGATTQVEWHAGFNASRTWRAIDELALVGFFTNSAAARSGTATTESYRYWTVGLRYRRGL